MASVSEQLAQNISLSTFSKATELKKRIWFTLTALVVYRFGTYVPLPGVDPVALKQVFDQTKGGILGMFDVFAGGALSRMTIFALSIFPYISASIIIQLMTSVSPHLEAIKKEGESGRKKLNQYTRFLTVVLSSVQAYGMSIGLESMNAPGGASVVLDPGMFFRVTSVVTMVGGTVFLMWLGEQITSRGVGNGISLIIFSGIVASLPSSIVALFEMGRTGSISSFTVLLVVVMALSVIAFVVFMERAQRRVPVQYPKRQMSPGQTTQAQTSHMPLKVNSAGVIPPIFAGALLGLPATITGFNQGSNAEWMTMLSTYLSHGNPVFMTVYASLIIFFSFFYTAIIFNPEETAENLKKYGGFVPGIRPGKNTADYFDFVLTRLTVIGAAYLTAVCLLPELMNTQFGVPFTLGGTSLLILVSVGMDTVTQVHSHLVAQQYESLMKRVRLKGKRK